MHNARNWRPVAQKAGRRRVTELGFAGWDVVMSHPALLFQRRPPGRNLRNPSVVRPLWRFANAYTGRLRYGTGSGSEWGASEVAAPGGAPLATAPCTVPEIAPLSRKRNRKLI